MPHWYTQPPSAPPRSPGKKTIGHNLNRIHSLAKSQWLEHLAHAEVCHKHLEQLGLRKRKLFDCLQNIFVLHLLLFNELAVGKPFANPLVDSDSLYLFSSLSSVQHLSEEVLLVDREPVVLPASELPLDPTIQEGGLRRRLLRKRWTVESWKCEMRTGWKSTPSENSKNAFFSK